MALNLVEPRLRPPVDISLTDGVGELDVTEALEVYTQPAAARTLALATGDSVRTWHGLVLLTTFTRRLLAVPHRRARRRRRRPDNYATGPTAGP